MIEARHEIMNKGVNMSRTISSDNSGSFAPAGFVGVQQNWDLLLYFWWILDEIGWLEET